MANIRLDVDFLIIDGMDITFKAPADCSKVTGLVVHYPSSSGLTSKEFSFVDANGNNLANINNLFATGAYVKVILDTVNSKAFIQNADTNAYLESHIQNKKNPHGTTAEQIGAVACTIPMTLSVNSSGGLCITY